MNGRTWFFRIPLDGLLYCRANVQQKSLISCSFFFSSNCGWCVKEIWTSSFDAAQATSCQDVSHAESAWLSESSCESNGCLHWFHTGLQSSAAFHIILRSPSNYHPSFNTQGQPQAGAYYSPNVHHGHLACPLAEPTHTQTAGLSYRTSTWPLPFFLYLPATDASRLSVVSTSCLLARLHIIIAVKIACEDSVFQYTTS